MTETATTEPDFYAGQIINLPAEPPIGTTLRGDDVFGRITITRTPEGWVIDGQDDISPLSWKAALDCWGPGQGSPFVVVSVPAQSSSGSR